MAFERFAARFSFRDLTDFLLIDCRGDLSDIAALMILGACVGPGSASVRPSVSHRAASANRHQASLSREARESVDESLPLARWRLSSMDETGAGSGGPELRGDASCPRTSLPCVRELSAAAHMAAHE